MLHESLLIYFETQGGIDHRKPLALVLKCSDSKVLSGRSRLQPAWILPGRRYWAKHDRRANG